MTRLAWLRLVAFLLLELVLFAFAGCILGCFTGLLPGVHSNTVCVLILAIASGTGNMNWVVLIVAMSVAQSFVDFVPSIALGAPSEGSFIAALPGHRMLMRGHGMYAIRLSIAGGILGTVIAIAMLPVFVLFVWRLGGLLYEIIAFILIAVLLMLIIGEKGLKKKFWAVAVLALSAGLGFATLQNGIVREPLFPLITGFFGASNLLYSIGQKNACVKQDFRSKRYAQKGLLIGSALSTIAGSLVALLPSVGPSEAALVVRRFAGNISTSRYMAMLGGINTSNAIYAFVVLFLLGKSRTGAAAAVSELLELTPGHMMLIIAVIIFAAGFGALATEILARKTLCWVEKVNYSKLGVITVALLAALVFALSGALGLLAFASATAVGLVAITSGVKRSICMAFLMVPTIGFYLAGGYL